MYSSRDKDAEQRFVFKCSLLLSLCFLVLVFYLFPRFSEIKKIKTEPLQISIYVSDIPQTHQPTRKPHFPPARSVSSLYVPVEDQNLPEEVNHEAFYENKPAENFFEGISPEIPAKCWLEVYPSTLGVTCKGYIRLLLLVNARGQVETVEILENTTMADTCLSLVRQAAFKSRWIPAEVKGQPVNSWVTKVYKFNLPK